MINQPPSAGTAGEEAEPVRRGFSSLAAGGLDWDCLPLRLYVKGNRKFWNPADIDFTQDRDDWAALPAPMRAAFTGLGAMFLGGEEAVTRDLQPFMTAMAAEGRFADEIYLTQFCFEEGRHVEVFRRWLDAVGVTHDLNAVMASNPGYLKIFHEVLPRALRQLTYDPGPASQVRASVTYNHVVEGTLALTGYHAWNLVCERLGIFPGMRQVIARIGDDERRHMAWGTYTCRRHVAAYDEMFHVARKQLRSLLPHAIHMIQTSARQYPFDLIGVSAQELLLYATGRAQRRMRAIESARGSVAGTAEADRIPELLEDSFAREDSHLLAPAGTL
jgi:ribonucleoside-diphosphate reductase beta chain